MEHMKSQVGTGIVPVLLVAFILAKVFGVKPVAAWSWWWVFSPLWISALIVISVVAVVFVIAVIADAKKG